MDTVGLRAKTKTSATRVRNSASQIAALGREISRKVLDEASWRLRYLWWTRKNVANVPTPSGSVALHHRRTPSDLEVVWACFRHRQFDVPYLPEFSDFARLTHRAAITRSYRSIVERGRVPLIVDCGAHIGTSAVWFTMTYPEAYIVALEPAPDNHELLLRNTAGREVEVLNAGIAAHDGDATLVDPGQGGWSYRTGVSGSGPRVRMISLKTILAGKPDDQFEPFILKVDIEGGEKSLFSQDWDLLDRFALIVLESHDFMLPGQHTSSSFFAFHSTHRRDFSYNRENLFSIAYERIAAGSTI